MRSKNWQQNKNACQKSMNNDNLIFIIFRVFSFSQKFKLSIHDDVTSWIFASISLSLTLNSNGKIDVPVPHTPEFSSWISTLVWMNFHSSFLFLYFGINVNMFSVDGVFRPFFTFLSYVSFTGEKIIKLKFYEESKN